MSDDWVIQFQRCKMYDHRHFTFGRVTLRNANIGEDYWKVELGKIPSGLPHYQALEEVIANLHKDEPKGRGAILYGQKATGKTSAGVICLKEAIARGGQTYMLRALKIPDVAANRDDRLTSEGIPIWEMLLQRQILLLDDLGQEASKSYGETTTTFVEEIVRARYDADLTTYITTNGTLEDLLKMYAAIDTILMDPTRFQHISVGGKFWRKGE